MSHMSWMRQRTKKYARLCYEKLRKSGDNGVNDDAPVEPCPTRREVLQVASVINKYIDSVDDPTVARKLKGILASFKHQMRLEMPFAMNSTH